MGLNKFQPGCCCGCCLCLDGNPPVCDDGSVAICNPSGLWSCEDRSNPHCAIDMSNPTCSGCQCCATCDTPKQYKMHINAGWFVDGNCPCASQLNDQDHFLNHSGFGVSSTGCSWGKFIVGSSDACSASLTMQIDGCHGGTNEAGITNVGPSWVVIFPAGGVPDECCKPFAHYATSESMSADCAIDPLVFNSVRVCFTPEPPCPCSSCCYAPLPKSLRITWTPAGFLIDGAHGTCTDKDTKCDANIQTTFWLIPVSPDGDNYCKWQYTGGGYTVTTKVWNSTDGTCSGGNIDPYCDPITGLTHGVDSPNACVAQTRIQGPCFDLTYCGQGNCCLGVGGTFVSGTQTCCDLTLDAGAGCSIPNFITLNWFPI